MVYSHGFLETLLLVPTSGGPAGYLQLPANLAAAISAHLLPLELAPVAPTVIAFAIQLLPVAVVLWGRSHLWATPGRRLACLAVLLLAPPIRPTVWLATTHSQVFCGLTAFLILGLATYWNKLYSGIRFGNEITLSLFGYGPGRPDWRPEVERWRANPRYRLRIWPYQENSSWRVNLVGPDDFTAPQAALDAVGGARLVASGRPAERGVAVDTLPADFRLQVHGQTLGGRARLEVLCEDGAGETVARRRSHDLEAPKPFLLRLHSSRLEVASGRDLGETRFVILRAASSGGEEALVVVASVEILPRIQGLFDGVL